MVHYDSIGEKKLNKRKIIVYVVSIIVVELLGFVVGMATKAGTALYAESIVKPPLAPPGIVFPIAWTILYCLMAVGFARVLLNENRTNRAVLLFLTQLTLNLMWCFIFFTAQAYIAAFIELVIMLIIVILMSCEFSKIDRIAGILQIPYIIWLCFAAYLNMGVILLN